MRGLFISYCPLAFGALGCNVHVARSELCIIHSWSNDSQLFDHRMCNVSTLHSLIIQFVARVVFLSSSKITTVNVLSLFFHQKCFKLPFLVRKADKSSEYHAFSSENARLLSTVVTEKSIRSNR